jgi:threonine synthase
MAAFEVYCVKCNKTASSGYRAFCDACDGMIDVRYDTNKVTLQDSPNPYERFAAILPVRDPATLLPRDAIYTPTLQAKNLGAYLRMPSLYLKNETVLPTGTTKDRMADISLAYLWEQGVREFCTSSTGNSSSSYAYAISSYRDMRLYLFTAESFVHRVNFADKPQVVHFGLRDGTFVEAFNFSGIYAQRHGLVSERGFFNLGRREGLKIAFLEASDQVPTPIDWYVQAVSSAMGVYGTYKGAQELLSLGRIARLPRLLCVQQETCAPMVRAFESGAKAMGPEHIVKRPTGIAEAILRGDPSRAYPHVLNIVLRSNGCFASVSEHEIREARRMVEELEGVSPCFSASTALAAVIKLVRKGKFPLSDTVLVNLTGSDRQPAEISSKIHWLRRSRDEWISESLPGENFIQPTKASSVADEGRADGKL